MKAKLFSLLQRGVVMSTCILSVQTNTAGQEPYCPGSTNSEGCNPYGQCGNGTGMAVYSFSEYLPGVVINDTPLTYAPTWGPAVDLMLRYREVNVRTEVLTAASNLGPAWHYGYES